MYYKRQFCVQRGIVNSYWCKAFGRLKMNDLSIAECSEREKNLDINGERCASLTQFSFIYSVSHLQ